MIDRHVVRVVEPGIADTDAHALGHGIRFNYEALQSYCWRRLDEVDIDLLVVASGVALADRQITRHRSKQWARDICVELPVHDVAPWEQAEEQLDQLRRRLLRPRQPRHVSLSLPRSSGGWKEETGMRTVELSDMSASGSRGVQEPEMR